MNVAEQMKLFLEPRSVAIVGASRRVGEDIPNVLVNLLDLGFAGKIYPINPGADEILGVKTYHNIREVPDRVDLVIISTPHDAVLQIVKDCVIKGVKAMVILAQGFADGDQHGAALQQEIMRVVKRNGARILGPNTLGVANAFINFTSAYRPIKMERVPIGLICQTGVFIVGSPDFKLVGKGIDLGNACDVTFADGLEYFEQDPDVKLIVLHIEGLREGKRFLEVGRRVAKKKPILVLKTGKSKRGAKAAVSHTGSMVGKDEVYETAFKRCGFLRVSDIDELKDAVRAFLYLPMMRGRGVGVITVTGAGGIMAADACEKAGLKLVDFSPQCGKRMESLSPPWQNIGNPLDIAPATTIMGHPRHEVYRVALQSILDEQDVDGLLFISGVIEKGKAWDPSPAAIETAEMYKDKPVVFWCYGHYAQEVITKLERTGKILAYPSVERAVRVLSQLAEYSQFLEEN
jgi:acetyltransferase